MAGQELVASISELEPIPHKNSPCTTLLIEELSSETSLQQPWELWVGRRVV